MKIFFLRNNLFFFTELTEHDLHIEHTQGNIDVTVPTVYTIDDIRDDKHNPWTKWTWLRRSIIYASAIFMVACLVRLCYSDYYRQLSEGGFQGLWIGGNKKIL